MPELNWVGKDKVITHHLDVPFRVLERQYSFDESGQHDEDNGSPNMIIHGDNLEALKALLPTHEGKIDCIYIDPPYNTGNEGWVYNDNVNDPQIRRWLGEVVGKEGEDLSRHDKWLCMMYPRLRLLSKLLSDKGVLVASLSFHELPNLLGILREIFASRQVVTVPVQTSGGKPSGGFNYVHEYLVFVTPRDFLPNSTSLVSGSTRTPYEGLTLSTFDQTQRPNQAYPVFVNIESLTIEGVGPSLQELINLGLFSGDKQDYEFHSENVPDGCVAVWPITSKGKPCVWRHKPERLLSDWRKGYIKVSRVSDRISIQYLPSGVITKILSGELETLGHEEGVPTLRFGVNTTSAAHIGTIQTNKHFFTVRGSSELSDIFPENPKVFTYPKPVDLIQYVIDSVADSDAIVLDSFAGSGTTGHAVLRSNNENGFNRSFILIELSDYADSVTAERVKRTIQGYKSQTTQTHVLFEHKLTAAALKKGEALFAEAEAVAKDAQGKYTKVSKPRLVTSVSGKTGSTSLQVVAVQEHDEDVSGTGGAFSYFELGDHLFVEDSLNPAIDTAHVLDYVWFTETGSAGRRSENPPHRDYLGEYQGTAYFFAYDAAAVTTLDYEYLAGIPAECGAESYVMYADLCTLSDRELAARNITFKKIPRDITRL